MSISRGLMKKNHNTMHDSGISEIVSIVLIIFLVVMMVGVVLYITGALDEHLTTTPYLATSADVVNVRPDLRTISLENRGGDSVSLYGSAAAGGIWSVRFRLQSDNISTDVEVDPLLKTGQWGPGGTLNIYRENQTYWVTDNISARADQIEDFGGGKWVVSIIDTGTDVLLAQHTLTLSGSAPPGPVYAHGIVATYYSDEGWSNAAGTRIEHRIRFSDGTGETDEVNWPHSILGKTDEFSVKFEGLLYIETEADYTFYLGSDDGSWLSINGVEIIDNGGLHSLRYVSKTVHLTAGYHPIVVKMYEHTGQAAVYLEYESPLFPRQYVTALFHIPVSIPHADFSAIPQHTMTGQQVYFTDKSDDATEWHWEFGDSASSTDRNPSHTYNTAGSYTVSLTAKNSYGTDTMTKTDYITIGGTLSHGIVATYYSDEGWSNAAGTRIENRIRFSDGTTNTDEAHWPHSILGKTDEFSVKYEGFIYIDTEADYTFYLGSDDGSWLSINGAEIIDNGGLHSLRYVSKTVHLTAGYHPIVVKMYEHTGQAAIYLEYESPLFPRQYVTALFHTPVSVPHADFTATPQHIMTGEQVWFTDKSDDATEWQWEFGDTGSSTDRNPTHTYNTAGSYTVSLTAKNSYGADTMTKTDYITVGGTLLPGINATYYSDEGWSNAVSTRTENRIRFSDSWGDTDEVDWPFSILGKEDEFSVKFEGLLNITTEDDYTFCLGSDDGSWLFIDGAEIIDNGGLHSLRYVSGTVHLTAGYHPIVVRMFEHTGGAMIYLKYNSEGGPYVENLFVLE